MVSKKLLSFVLAILLMLGLLGCAYAIEENERPSEEYESQIDAEEALEASQHDRYILDFEKKSEKLDIFFMKRLFSFVVESDGLEQKIDIWFQDVDVDKDPMVILLDPEGRSIPKSKLKHIEAKRYSESENIIFEFTGSEFIVNGDVFIENVEDIKVTWFNSDLLDNQSDIIPIEDVNEESTQSTEPNEETEINKDETIVEVPEVNLFKNIGIALGFVIAAIIVVVIVLFIKNKGNGHVENLEDGSENNKVPIRKVEKKNKNKKSNFIVSDNEKRKPINESYESTFKLLKNNEEDSKPKKTNTETDKTDIEPKNTTVEPRDTAAKSDNNPKIEILEEDFEDQSSMNEESIYNKVVDEINSIYASNDNIPYSGKETFATLDILNIKVIKGTPKFVIDGKGEQYILVEDKYIFTNYKKWSGAKCKLVNWYSDSDKIFDFYTSSDKEINGLPMGRRIKKVYPAEVKEVPSAADKIYELVKKGKIIIED